MRAARARELVASGGQPDRCGTRRPDQPTGDLPAAEASATDSWAPNPRCRGMRRSWRSLRRIPRMGPAWWRLSPVGSLARRSTASGCSGSCELTACCSPCGDRIGVAAPGFFRVRRPDELWHMDMTKVWTAAHGWVYLHVIIDCCTREIAAWTLDLRCRTDEAIACVDTGLLGRNMGAQRLTIGTDNGTQFTSRRFLRHLADHHISHRRGGYRDPESQAFIESWFGQFKKRVAVARRMGNH